MSLSDLPDLRFVYFDWHGPVRAYQSDSRPCRLHRWTFIPPGIRAATGAAGLPEPMWYAGPTSPLYCKCCGVFRDQDAARRIRWKVRTLLGGRPRELDRLAEPRERDTR